MKSTRMIQAVAVAAVTLMAAAVFVSVVAESSDAVEADPTITDCGFVKDKKAFFYYSKFGTSGFEYSDSKSGTKITPRSISGDEPTKGVGKVMKDDSLYASISKLDNKAQYYLAIEERDKAGALNYGVIVTLKASVTTTYVFMSVLDGQPYSETTALSTVAMSGCANAGFTTEVTNDISYTFRLTTDKDAKADALVESKVDNPLQFSKIFHFEVITNELVDNVNSTGKYYGYSSTKPQYAGNGLSYGDGKYIVGFFITNVPKANVQINVDASSKFTVPTEKILYGMQVTTGYGYFVLSQADYPNENFDKVSVTLGADGASYASASVSTDDGDDKKNNAGLYMIVGVAAVFIAAILIAMAYKGSKKVE